MLKLSITIDRPTPANLRMVKKLPAMHPGEVLREEFLAPLALSAGKLARICGVPRPRIDGSRTKRPELQRILHYVLSKAFGATAQMWLNLQNSYDMQVQNGRSARNWMASSG